jgi:predicted nucleic acid-binding protein
MIVSNSSPLIGFGRIGRLNLLKDLFELVVIPGEVKAETVDRGLENKSPDAYVIRSAIAAGWIHVREVRVLPGLEDFGIDAGEAEALSLAKELGVKEVLIDERHARLAAKALGLQPRGILYVLFLALRKGLIDIEEYESCLDELRKAGFRLGEDVYREALNMGRQLKGSI